MGRDIAQALGPASPRELVHLRRIECAAYHRADGLVDVDAWLVDTRGHDIPTFGRSLPAGEALHELGLRLTIDLSHRVLEAKAVTMHGPSPECPEITAAYTQLVGLDIGPGFREKAKALLRGRAGCTHLTELLGPLVTTAMQATWWLRAQADHSNAAPGAPQELPGNVDSCHAWRSDGLLVLQMHRKPE